MQDNAPSHAARHSMAYLVSIGINSSRLMDWPPASPDIKPIENCWGIIKRHVYAENKQFASNDTLWVAIKQLSTLLEEYRPRNY